MIHLVLIPGTSVFIRPECIVSARAHGASGSVVDIVGATGIERITSYASLWDVVSAINNTPKYEPSTKTSVKES